MPHKNFLFVFDLDFFNPIFVLYEPSLKKTNNLAFCTGPTQTKLYKHRRWLEAGNFRFRKDKKCTVRVAKTKALLHS